MKKYMIAVFLLFWMNHVLSQNTILFCEQVEKVSKLIQDEHINPKKVDDNLSNAVFDLFTNNLDLSKQFLTNEDILVWKEDINKIDNYILDSNCNFIEKYIVILESNIIEVKEYLKNLSAINLKYGNGDKINFSPKEKLTFFKDKLSLENFWKRKIKYLVLKQVIEDNPSSNNLKEVFKKTENSIRNNIIDKQICLLDELLNQKGGIDLMVKTEFINSLLHYQDPHSTYFSFSEKALFESSLVKNQETFGIITTKTKKGNIKIIHLLPGSEAFKNDKIEKEDTIVFIKSGENILNVSCISNNDVLSFLNEDKHQKIELSVKKRNGIIEKVNLTKKQIELANNSVRSYILGDDLKIGYLKINSFYSNLESLNGLGLANDVAKEIFRLQKEKINGLIIDLRFNGGGSMKEAIDLSGMFINRGDLAIIKERNQELLTVKDYNRGSMYSKPLVIMVNNYSASASELFASIMQDYKRAIIVGVKTYGKASMQRVIPLDSEKNNGYCKLTVGKFYRVTGKSHQSVGVEPNIYIPSLYDGFDTDEQFKKFALANDSISANSRYTLYKEVNLDFLRNNSKLRIDNNTQFDRIKKVNTRFLKTFIQSDYSCSLSILGVKNRLKIKNELWDDFTEIEKNSDKKIKVNNTSFTNELLAYNKNDLEVNVSIIDEISKSEQINEVYLIIKDLITKQN